jgi:hemoglobin-like flavoprotein
MTQPTDTDADIRRLRESFASAMRDADTFGQTFYARLFALAPSARALFPDSLEAQQQKLVHALHVLMRGLDHPDPLEPLLRQLGLLADADVQRQRAQQRHLVLRGHARAAALAEDVLGMAAVGADVDGHVLDNAEHRHFDLANILRAFFASSRAMSCGVVTMIAADTGTFWHRVSWMSPVPGGRSMTR